jgi:hypothetical protein
MLAGFCFDAAAAPVDALATGISAVFTGDE